MAARIFTSFDFDHDESLRNLLVGQSRHEDTPFEICDWSVKEPFTGNWRKKVRERINKCEQVIVICGEHTDSATGVSAELEIAQELRLPYFLLWGYSGKTCVKPNAANQSDKIYNWSWDNLQQLIKGNR
jgi:hypothetical protein